MARFLLNSQHSGLSSYSMIRRLCSTVTNPSLHFGKELANPFTFPDCRLSFVGRGNWNKLTGQKCFVGPQYFSPVRKMGAGRRPSSVDIAPIDKGNRPEWIRALEESLRPLLSMEPIRPSPNPLIIVISGPSGVGKDAVIRGLRGLRGLREVRESLHFVVTATSRAMRPREVDGKDYYFVSKEEFLSMVERDELLEYALVYGDYKGIPKQKIRDYMSKGYDIVLRVDIQGAATLKKIFGNSAVFIFLVAESELALVNRLIDRKTETIEALMVRVATAREEVKHVKKFDYVVVNAEGQLQNAVKLVESIIDAEKAKVSQRKAVV